jgi:hypothetical protein
VTAPVVEVRHVDNSEDLRSAVFQALGAASACWDDLSNAGVFQSERARGIGEELLERIAAEHAAFPVLVTERGAVTYDELLRLAVDTGEQREAARSAVARLEAENKQLRVLLADAREQIPDLVLAVAIDKALDVYGQTRS